MARNSPPSRYCAPCDTPFRSGARRARGKARGRFNRRNRTRARSSLRRPWMSVPPRPYRLNDQTRAISRQGEDKKVAAPIRGQSVDRILSLHLVGRRSRAPARNRSWNDLWPRSPNTPAARPALTRGVSGLPDIRAGKAEQERTRSETWCNSLGEWAGHLGRERSLPINAGGKPLACIELKCSPSGINA